MTANMLEIVDDNDAVIGTESREKIHELGLLHRQVHVWFLTPQGELVLQHRAKDKDSFPDMLDATVGGHVEIGQSYDEAALMETREETGVELTSSDLIPIVKLKTYGTDPVTGSINNSFKQQYAHIYRGAISDLKIEKGKAIGFEAWPVDKMFSLTDAEKARVIPLFVGKEFQDVFRKIQELL